MVCCLHMESNVLYALASVVLVSTVSLIGVVFVSVKEALLKKVVFFLVSVSAGALFGNVFVHLIPEAYAGIGSGKVSAFFIFTGILIFFALEKFLSWRHRHGVSEEECEHCETENDVHHVRPIGPLILVADGLHNIIDGVIIGASYLVSIEVGIAVTVAVILHEIPQEIGDFGLLLHAGIKRLRALLLNFASALLSIVGVVFALLVGSVLEPMVPYLLALAAGNFLYIAGSDILPELHKTTNTKRSLIQFFSMIFGFLVMVWIA
jgi:zinc and cadmium transporter